MGKLRIGVLFFCFLCQVALIGLPQASAEDVQPEITVCLDGEILSFDVPPAIEDGRALVPVRTLFEALRATVVWDDNTKTVTATKGSTRIVLSIGSPNAENNGKTAILDVPARIVDGRTLVPLRFVAESLNCQVNWNPETKRITINSESASSSANTPVFKKKNDKYYYMNDKLYATYTGSVYSGVGWQMTFSTRTVRKLVENSNPLSPSLKIYSSKQIITPARLYVNYNGNAYGVKSDDWRSDPYIVESGLEAGIQYILDDIEAQNLKLRSAGYL